MAWHYNLKGQQVGPVTEAEVVYHIKTGALTANDKVLRDGMTEWISVSEAFPRLNGVKTDGHISKSGEIQCIRCGSTQLHSGARGYSFWRGGIFGSSQVIITCLKCGQKFKPGGEPY